MVSAAFTEIAKAIPNDPVCTNACYSTGYPVYSIQNCGQ